MFRNYQLCKPVTRKNIGKELVKPGRVTYDGKGGSKERQRRLKQEVKRLGSMTDLDGDEIVGHRG